MTKFGLGSSSIDYTLYQPTPKTGRKRSFSQSKLDNFLTPNSSSGECLLSDSVLSLSNSKKPRPFSLVTKKSGKSKKKKNRKLSSSSKMATPTSAKAKKKKKERKLSKSCSTPATPKSPVAVNIHGQTYSSVTTPKSPRNKAEALKVLNKAKRFKQMDLKKSVINKNDMSPAELEALKERQEQERQRKVAQLEEEKRKRDEEKKEREEERRKMREERMRQIREQQEQQRLEKLKKIEWLKPREDLTCEDSVVSGKVHRGGNG